MSNDKQDDEAHIQIRTIRCTLPSYCENHSSASGPSFLQSVHYTTLSSGDFSVTISDLGATIVSLQLGKTDIVLGFDDPRDYARSDDNPYFGCVVGRVANRIKGGRYCLDENVVRLPELNAENGANHLHGGTPGWSRRLWRMERGDDGRSVTYRLRSEDGEGGYSGATEASATYRIVDDGRDGTSLRLEMECAHVGGGETPVNMTNHSYFNLAGEGDVRNHVLTVPAKFYTPADDTNCPTGEVREVEACMDWRKGRSIGDGLLGYAVRHNLGSTHKSDPWGFDHNYVVDGEGMREVALLTYPPSGRSMRVFSDAPGVQVYTANYLDGITGKGKRRHGKWDGVCLETQAFPNSVGEKLGVDEAFLRGKCFILSPSSEKYKHTVEYQFNF